MHEVINNVILSIETTPNCLCFPKDISDKLTQYDGQIWNVFCSESLNH